MKISLLYVPCANKSEALRIARVLIREKLAACVNIISSITSVYEWDNKLEEGEEALMLIKTKKSSVKKARDKIKGLHSYQVPCISEIELSSVNKPFAEWIARQCKV